MTYRDIQRENVRRRLDKATWAGPAVVVVSQDVEGSGSLITDEIVFGTVFEDVPFFRYGVEVIEGTTPLVDGDFPFVTAGVSEWTYHQTDEEDQFGRRYYMGAFVYLNVVSFTSYKLRFRFSFEGTALRNPEFFQGSA